MNIFAIIGSSGSGKTTVVNRLTSMNLAVECISHTTRKPRENEVNGKTYYFVSEAEFKAIQSANGFAECVTYDGNMYGIAKREIERVFALGKDIVVIVERGGFLQLKEAYPNCVSIFIDAPLKQCLDNMSKRGDTRENIKRRIATYNEEQKHKDDYDFVIENTFGELYNTVSKVSTIMKAKREMRHSEV